MILRQILPDKVLQAPIMSYPDAHRYRLCANYQQLLVNQLKCPVMHYQRDGAMALGNMENRRFDHY